MTAIVMLGVAGCGGSSHTTNLPLNAYLVRSGEQPGFHSVHEPSYLATPAQFDSGDPDSGLANHQFARAGFRRAISLHTARSSAQGISAVVELGTPAAARQEQIDFIGQTRALMSSHGPAPVRFSVPGVPDAVGLADRIAANVIYAEGRCLVIVGDETQSSSPQMPAASGARAIYRRTHAHSGACTR